MPSCAAAVAFAAVSADESRAAEVGRDILQNGGNATDAAVAMYFAMAVTLPSAAGLGASGACIVHDDKTKGGRGLRLRPDRRARPHQRRVVHRADRRAGHDPDAHSPWPVALGAERSRPAERLARFGVPVSRALSRDLQAGASLLGADREARRIFGKGSGGTVTEGDIWTQGDLAGTLGAIRQRGGGEFFQGALARTLSDQIAQMGGSLPLEALRNAVPQSGPPTSESHGGYRGLCRAAADGRRQRAGRAGTASAPAGRVPTDSGRHLGLRRGRQQGGGAAPCSLSMGQLFGARMIVPGTGILLGAPTADSTAVSPMIIGNPNNGEFTVRRGRRRFAQRRPGDRRGRARRDPGQQARCPGARRARRAGRLRQRHRLSRRDCAAGGSTCQSGIDPAGAGLALLAVTLQSAAACRASSRAAAARSIRSSSWT